MKELLEICREYVTAIRLKNAMGDAGDDAVRATELAAYFTHCNLQPAHLMLALNLAMTASFKAKCFITAAGFARRLLELPDIASEKNAQVRSKAQKVLQKSEAQARNEHELAYDERNPFVVDCSALTPIYRGAPVVRCAFCGSAYEPSFKGKVCVTCGLALVGGETPASSPWAGVARRARSARRRPRPAGARARARRARRRHRDRPGRQNTQTQKGIHTTDRRGETARRFRRRAEIPCHLKKKS